MASWGEEKNMSSTELSLIDSGIESLDRVPLGPHLLSLNLHCNTISRICHLDHLVKLTHLDLSSNQIHTIEGIDSLTSLRVLNLSCNVIEAVQGLKNLRSLVKLNLSYNQVQDLSGFQDIQGPAYKLSHIDLYGNQVRSLAHIIRCLQGCVQLRRLTLSQGGADNPVCHSTGYWVEMLSSLPQLQVLDGRDPTGQPCRDAAVLADVPGLQQYMDLLFSDSSTDPIVAATPRIDAALDAFREKGVSTPEMSTTLNSDQDTSQHDQPHTEGRRKLSTDHEVRLETLEHQMLRMLYSTKGDVSKHSPGGVPKSPGVTKHFAKRDVDDTDESEKDQHASHGKLKRKAEPGSKQNVQPTTTRSGKRVAPSRQVAGKPVSKKTDSRGTEDVQSGRVTAAGTDARLRDDTQSTYVQLMKELEVERERRWKAEQASKKLVDHIKDLQSKGREDAGVQDAALGATKQLKLSLTNEREVRVRLQEELQSHKEEVQRLIERVQEMEAAEAKCRTALHTAEDTMAKMERDNLQQQAHQARRVQEAQLKAAAGVREAELLRAAEKTLKGQLHQLQELLAAREQEHRKQVENHYSADSPQLQQLIQREVDRAEKAHQQLVADVQTKLDASCRQYSELEEEFRMALHVEGARFTELQTAYERLSQEAADNRQALGAARDKDGRTTAAIADLTSLVKEQKGRLTELTRAKQESAADWRERVGALERHLEEARRRMVQLELLKQDKMKLTAQVTSLESLVEGLRQEKKVWGAELAHQESGLAQDRGRLEVKIEMLGHELSSAKKQLEREADALRIKSKMVDDQTDTIRKLKEGLLERDEEVRRTREEVVAAQRELEEQLSTETEAHTQLQEKYDQLKDRKAQLKDEVNDLQSQLDDTNKTHSVMSRQWEKKAGILGELERQVGEMKASWERKEAKLAGDRDKAIHAASLAVEKLKSMDSAFRTQLDSKESSHQEALRGLAEQNEDEIDAANKRVVQVEEEMRQLLRETENNKRAMDERVKKLTRAFSDLQDMT